MTIDELIAELKKYPGDMPVISRYGENNENVKWVALRMRSALVGADGWFYFGENFDCPRVEVIEID